MSRAQKRRILIRALEIVGDREQLARILGTSTPLLNGWLDDSSELPDEYYLRAVDLCLDHDTPPLWGDTPPADTPPRSPH